MSLTRTHIVTLILCVLFGFAVAAPRVADALGMQGDIECGTKYCFPGKCVPSPKDPKCVPCPTFTCTDVTSGFSSTGTCVNSVPGLCKATGTSGPNGFGLDQVAKMLGDLMGKLMGQGGGKQDGAQPPPATNPTYNTPPTCSLTSSTVSSTASSTTATLSWSTSGDATSASITPNVGTVSPNGSQDVTVTATTPYSMTVTGPGGSNYCSGTVIVLGGGDTCSGLYASLYGCDDDDDDDDDTTSTSTTASLSANPASGVAPLSVTFTGNAGRPGYTINYGDGKSTPVGCANGSCSRSGSALTINRIHVYETAGTYVATLNRHLFSDEVECQSEGCNVIASVTITVTAPASNANTTTNATGTIYNPFFQNTTPAYLLPAGLRGDIQILNSGGTVIAGSRDQSRNTEIAGFYGSNTFSGQPQGVVATLCRARPWSNNILSYVLPANFFDSLCIARGYQVGAVQATTTSVTVTQTRPQPIQRATTTVPRATSTVPSVPPRVRVWAVPAAVPLGSRTSIFWTSQGVVSCTVASPDGSFSQTTLSGGASTVPLTGATTFTMSCLTADGTPVTSFVTVNLAI